MDLHDFILIISLKNKAIKEQDYIVAGYLREAEKHLRKRLGKELSDEIIKQLNL